MKYWFLMTVTACAPQATGYQIVIANTSELTTVSVGDSISLAVNQTFSDGSVRKVPANQVTWGGAPLVTAQSATARDDSPFPAFGAEPTAVFIANPGRTDRAKDLDGVLFILDAGTGKTPTIQVEATVGGTKVTGVVGIARAPVGNATRGATLYGDTGANCARCHGVTGHGSDPDANGTTYTYDSHTYDFPAPGLNAEPGNCAADPDWNSVLFGIAAAADVDNGGFTLRAPMPDYLVATSDEHPQVLTAQDFADIFAFMQTQSE